jgi:FKBP-type peptidyl-prolyl cis-trans isomerase FkpA
MTRPVPQPARYTTSTSPRMPMDISAATAQVARNESRSTSPAPNTIYPPVGERFSQQLVHSTARRVSQSDLVVGTGTVATSGRLLTVNYSNWLYTAAEQTGRLFDSSLCRDARRSSSRSAPAEGSPAGTRGGRHVRRRSPASGHPRELANGSQGGRNGTIPPNAALVFSIELSNVQ